MPARTARTNRTTLRRELADLWRAFKGPFDPYRPERHYMRGPGPKWHAKRAPATTSDLPAEALPRPI